MLFVYAVYRSFVALRMTWVRFVVILSAAKDLYISHPGNEGIVDRSDAMPERKRRMQLYMDWMDFSITVEPDSRTL